MSENENIETPVVAEDVVEVKVEDTVEVVKPVEEKVADTVISLPEEEVSGPGLAPVADGAIGSTTVKTKVKPKAEPVAKPAGETVAIHSTRNVSWDGVGKVKTGYNIVTKEAADQWLKRNHVRLATPEEVAKEFGN